MKKALGFFGTMICSAGLLALPAAAQDHWNSGNRNNTQVYGQRGSANAQSPVYTGNSQVSSQRNARENQSYGQSYSRTPQRYEGFSNNAFDRGRDNYRDEDRYRSFERRHHDQRDHDRDRFDWR
jgi:hypothetical protein